MLPVALAFRVRVLRAALCVRVAAPVVPDTIMSVLAPLSAAASTAFCRRVLFTSICPPSSAKAPISTMAAKAIMVSTATDPR
ncbi:hypothetical protein D3C84_582250 [compost metagenome]